MTNPGRLSTPPRGVQRIQVLDRAIAVLRAIAASPQPLNAHELAKACGLNRTTAWRILVTLEQNELVDRDPSTQRYSLSYGLSQLGADTRVGSLIRLARPTLEALADTVGEQVSLGVPDHFRCTYVDHIRPRSQAPIPRWLGQSGPLHATASGKVFLARLPEREREALLPAELERFTLSTITDHGELAEELTAVRRDGFAMSYGEHEELTSAVCAGVFDPAGRLAAIVDVWGPTQRLPRSRLRVLGAEVRRAADEIEARLFAST